MLLLESGDLLVKLCFQTLYRSLPFRMRLVDITLKARFFRFLFLALDLLRLLQGTDFFDCIVPLLLSFDELLADGLQKRDRFCPLLFLVLGSACSTVELALQPVDLGLPLRGLLFDLRSGALGGLE